MLNDIIVMQVSTLNGQVSIFILLGQSAAFDIADYFFSFNNISSFGFQELMFSSFSPTSLITLFLYCFLSPLLVSSLFYFLMLVLPKFLLFVLFSVYIHIPDYFIQSHLYAVYYQLVSPIQTSSLNSRYIFNCLLNISTWIFNSCF